MSQNQSANEGDKRNLILGLAWGLQQEDLQLFARSLRKATQSADVVLLTKDSSRAAQEMAAAERIQLLPLTNCYFGLCKSAAKRDPKESLKRIRNYFGIKIVNALMALAYPLVRVGYTREECQDLRREVQKLVVHTYSSRFVQYLDYLRNLAPVYDKVMLTDVRDVFFQSDPFAQTCVNQLWMFEEEGPNTLGTDGRNGKWVRAIFGNRILRQIADNRIICAGITIGGFANMTGYLGAMEPVLLSRTPVYIPDQAIHNVLARTGAFARFDPVVFKNGDGPVLTVGMMREEQFKFNAAGQLVNTSGEPYAVIHQFDRHPSLMEKLQKQLS